jgi:hypothetical protein
MLRSLSPSSYTTIGGYDAMSPLPTPCLPHSCQAQEGEYSVGVIRHGLGEDFAYPVVRCRQCDAQLFYDPADTWQSLVSVHRLMPLTNAPQAID